MKRGESRFLITYITYISHPPQGDEEASAEVADLEVQRRLFKIGTRYVKGPRCFLVTARVTAASPFTTFDRRDLNCFGYDVIFRRIWANSKGTRRVDSRFFSATIESSTINARINVLYQVSGKSSSFFR